MKINVYNHAVERYIERVDERKTPKGVFTFLSSVVCKERAKPRNNRRILRVPRDVDGCTYVYFYLKAFSPFGIPFYLAVDEDLTTVYTVLSEEQFLRTGRKAKTTPD